jgi:hypothetical protein
MTDIRGGKPALVTQSTCAVCNTRTERREMPSAAKPMPIRAKRVVSYWCPQCRHWEPSDEQTSDRD